MNRLAIVDPGFVHPHAHHKSVNLSIGGSLKARGASTLVLASQALDVESRHSLECAGLAYLPYFRTPCYPSHAECLAPDKHEEFASDFGDEVRRLYTEGIIDANDDLLFHTGYSFHYAGLARALWHLREQISGKIILCFMFDIGACPGWRGRELDVYAPRVFVRHKLAARVLSALSKSGMDIDVATSCRSYQLALQTIWPRRRVSIHPAINFKPTTLQVEAEKKRRSQVLIYCGGAKADKGVKFSAALGAAAAPALPDCRFVFHFNDGFPGADQFEADVGRLEDAGRHCENVTVLRGNLADLAYDQLLAESSIIFLLYDPEEYRYKTSGVFWDALRCNVRGLTWIVSEDTWAEGELRELGLKHTSVRYGDVEAGVSVLREILSETKTADQGALSSRIAKNKAYHDVLMRPFGDWLRDRAHSPPRRQVTGPRQRSRPRLLVVRTDYPHFGPHSGPGGFIPYLSDLGFEVDEVKVLLGDNQLANVDPGRRESLRSATHQYLRSYQLNSVPIETELQKNANHYDLVHFVDAEHSGLLSALARQEVPEIDGPPLIASFHQPLDMISNLVASTKWLKGFDRVHVYAADQGQFFGRHVARGKIVTVPHGIAEAILENAPIEAGSEAIANEMDELLPTRPGEKILLTVGNWRRDFDTVIATAAALEHRDDLRFVIVSNGLQLDARGLRNLTLINTGIADEALYALYRRAYLLFLPLLSGAANNAVLEAMAHGLPIVSTNIPAVDFYSAGLAHLAPPRAESFAALIEKVLEDYRILDNRNQMAAALRKRALELSWKNVAEQMADQLYRPLLAQQTPEPVLHEQSDPGLSMLPGHSS